MELKEIRRSYVEELTREIIGDDVNELTKDTIMNAIQRIEEVIDIQRKQITPGIVVNNVDDIIASIALDILLYPNNVRSINATFNNTEITGNINITKMSNATQTIKKAE